MGIFDIFKSKETKKQMQYAKMLNNTAPVFSQFGDDIYASDVVQQALYSIVKEMSKLNPKHIRIKGLDPIPVESSDTQWVLDNPNYLMTTSEFLEKITWNLLLNYNSFIYKQYDNSRCIIGLYPISPTNVTFLEDGTGKLYVKMLFRSGYESTLPYDGLIHWKSHFSANDLMGGNEFGQPDHRPLLETLKINDVLLQGVKKSLKASFAINGIVKYNTMLDDGSIERSIKEFEEKLQTSDSGMLGIDMKNDVIQFKRDIKVVDEQTLKFIDDKILRNFHTPIEIVRGNAPVEILESWYQGALEPMINSLSQVLTKGIFTERQKGFKNEVKLYPKELLFATMNQTLAMVNILGQSGALFENEKRVAFGFAPEAALVGVRQKSLNYVDVNIANEYQLKNNMKQSNKDTSKEGEESE